jgi:hypothetical protein
MPGDKIGVEMSQEYALDRERVLSSKGNVLIGVPLRVNDCCGACLLVSNQVRSVGQARQIELLEEHFAPPSLADRYFVRGTIRRYGPGVSTGRDAYRPTIPVLIPHTKS